MKFQSESQSQKKHAKKAEKRHKPKNKKTDEAASSGDSSTESKESDSSYSSEEDTRGESYKKGKEETIRTECVLPVLPKVVVVRRRRVRGLLLSLSAAL